MQRAEATYRAERDAQEFEARRELIVRRAERIFHNAFREAETSLAADAYEVAWHDETANTMGIQHALNPRSQPFPYTVNYFLCTCTCPHATGTVRRKNVELVAVGESPYLICKHVFIAHELALRIHRGEPVPMAPPIPAVASDPYNDFFASEKPGFSCDDLESQDSLTRHQGDFE